MDKVMYICPVCFQVCDSARKCHDHMMVECNPGEPGSDSRKPVTDRFGNMVSRAPRWYLEALGQIPAYTPLHQSKQYHH